MARSRRLVNCTTTEIRRKSPSVTGKTRFALSIDTFAATQGAKPSRLTTLLVSAAIDFEERAKAGALSRAKRH